MKVQLRSCHLVSECFVCGMTSQLNVLSVNCFVCNTSIYRIQRFYALIMWAVLQFPVVVATHSPLAPNSFNTDSTRSHHRQMISKSRTYKSNKPRPYLGNLRANHVRPQGQSVHEPRLRVPAGCRSAWPVSSGSTVERRQGTAPASWSLLRRASTSGTRRDGWRRSREPSQRRSAWACSSNAFDGRPVPRRSHNTARRIRPPGISPKTILATCLTVVLNIVLYGKLSKVWRPTKQTVGHIKAKANSALHPSGVSKWVPAMAGNAKAGMVHSVSEWTRGVQVKL